MWYGALAVVAFLLAYVVVRCYEGRYKKADHKIQRALQLRDRYYDVHQLTQAEEDEIDTLCQEGILEIKEGEIDGFTDDPIILVPPDVIRRTLRVV